MCRNNLNFNAAYLNAFLFFFSFSVNDISVPGKKHEIFKIEFWAVSTRFV